MVKYCKNNIGGGYLEAQLRDTAVIGIVLLKGDTAASFALCKMSTSKILRKYTISHLEISILCSTGQAKRLLGVLRGLSDEDQVHLFGDNYHVVVIESVQSAVKYYLKQGFTKLSDGVVLVDDRRRLHLLATVLHIC